MKISELIENIDRKSLNFKDVTKRIPELTAAAEKLRHGEISKTEYQDLVNKYKPISAYDEIPPSASDDQMHNALHIDKREKLNAKIEPGTPVKLRLDIPAYKDHGVWVPTIHDKKGTVISHGATAVIKNVNMSVPEKGALNIARGKSDTGKKIDKSPIATMNGEWIPTTVDKARSIAQHALTNPEWIQVGMDPERHSYFYDRKTQQPVIAADIAVQIGGLVLVHNPVYANKNDFIYELIDQEILEQLTYFGRPCTKDCSGHKAGRSWELKHNANTRANTPSNSFNNGTEIAINQKQAGTQNQISGGIRKNGKFAKFQPAPRSQK